MSSPRTNSCASFELRDAVATDYHFAQRLYVACMKPLLTDLGAWDEAVMLAKFDRYFEPEEVQIVQVDGADVGWVHVSETPEEIHLDQIHLEVAYQGAGIGTRIIVDLMAVARAKDKPVLLSLVRGNRAVTLYERLGFELAGTDPTKLHMRWEA